MNRAIVIVLLCGMSAFGQAPMPTLTDLTAYVLPQEEHNKIRDLQHENDQIEIENQKMLVQIEKNKAKQGANYGAIQLIVWDYAQIKKIDLSLNEFDPGPIRLVKKKVAK